jgi:hypothetical protein
LKTKYKIVLNGRNFQIGVDGRVRKLGFFGTRFVKARDAKDAELKAIGLIRKDSSLNISVRNAGDDPPVIYLSELSEVDSFAGISVPGEG